MREKFSSPFLGTFFQLTYYKTTVVLAVEFSSPFLGTFFQLVAKDTTHSKKLMSYIKSKDFFNGYYADKVMEINSDQKKSEKDENIERLLALEKAL